MPIPTPQRLLPALLLLFCFGSSKAWAENQIHSTIASRNGRFVVELSGPLDGSANTARVKRRVSRSEGAYLARTDTSFVAAAITNDGRYAVLNYHISSGGDGEAFVRTKKGEYRSFIDNGYAYKLVQAGRVPGLRESHFADEHGRNTFCGLSLAHAPERLVFTFGFRFVLDYSLEQRRITGWQRSLLQYWGWRKDRDSLFALRLDELSGQRGIALLMCETRQDGGDTYERLVTFPHRKENPKAAEPPSEFRLRAGTEEFIELAAKKVEEPSGEKQGVWEVNLSGRGRQFQSLEAKLTSARERFHLESPKEAEWTTPTTYLASPE